MSDLTKNKPFVECPCCGKKCYKGEYWGENDIIYIENLKECASCHLDTVYLSAARKQKKRKR